MAIFWFGLVCLILLGAALANKTPIPNAVVWAALGLAAGFIPGIPAFRLDPNIALFLILPPLVYSSAVQLPWPEFRANLRPISLLAIGLVVASTATAAALAHSVAGFPWAAAFVLGAIVSPTDPVAASAVAARVGLPHRLVAILEGEGLVNDAVSLSIFRIALAAAVTHHFSIAGGMLRFVVILVGEPLYGWLLGIGVARLRARIKDPSIEITVSLLTPFAAYLVPEHLGGSGILATVAAGMYMGEQIPTLVPAGTRLHATSFWQMIVFLLNGGLFLAAGLELRRVIEAAHAGSQAFEWALAIGTALAAVRIVWCVVSWYAFRAIRLALGRQRQPTPARELAVVAWSGMRGPVSLAAALSIPASAHGAAFPAFQQTVFITAIVVVLTLLLQGPALPWLVRLLGLSKDADAERRELREHELTGALEGARAALDRLSELQNDGGVRHELAERLRRYYEDRLDEARDEANAPKADAREENMRAQLIDAERARILELRNQGRISDYALERLQRSLDLRETLLD